MKLVAVTKSDQNRAAVDPWTAVHFGTGLAAGLTRVPFRWSILLALTYEVFEQVGQRRPSLQRLFHVSGPEILVNSVIDVAVYALGHRLGEHWNETE